MAFGGVVGFRRKLAATWTSDNTTLFAGELGYETDTRKFKFGDGTTAWNSLSYGVAVATSMAYSGLTSIPAAIDAIDGLTPAANKLAYYTGASTAALTDLTATALTLLDDTSTSAMRTTLGVAIGSNVQAWDADLDTIAGLTATTDSFMQAKAGAWAARTIAQVVADLNSTIAPVFANVTSKPTTIAGYGITDAATLTGSEVLTNKTIGNTNTITLKDTLFTLQDDGDTTKQARFQLSGLTTATTRTFTLPDVTDTIAVLGLAQTFSAAQTFSGQGHTLGNGTATGTTSIATGATLSGNTKTLNMGTFGVSGSITTIGIGPAASGATGTTTLNGPVIAFGANATAFNIRDNLLFLQDDGDATKQAQFQLSGITTGTTRTFTLPDVTGTLMLTSTVTTAAQEPAHTGDVTNSAGSLALAIATNAVTLAQMAQMATASFLGRTTASTGNVEVLSATQATAMLNTVTTSVKGLAPTLPNDATKYLDGTGAYSVPAGSGGTSTDYWATLQADYTLTSTTTKQKAFNWSTNGALTLPTGVYYFECFLLVSAMSSTSGNLFFDALGAGTATCAKVAWHSVGMEGTTMPNGTLAQAGNASKTMALADQVVVPGVGTTLKVMVRGTFDVTVTGTIIPSVSLDTAAAAVMNTGSYFKCTRTGATGTIAAAWS